MRTSDGQDSQQISASLFWLWYRADACHFLFVFFHWDKELLESLRLAQLLTTKPNQLSHICFSVAVDRLDQMEIYVFEHIYVWMYIYMFIYIHIHKNCCSQLFRIFWISRSIYPSIHPLGKRLSKMITYNWWWNNLKTEQVQITIKHNFFQKWERRRQQRCKTDRTGR